MAALPDPKQYLIPLYNELSEKRDKLYESIINVLKTKRDSLSMHRSYDNERQRLMDAIRDVNEVVEGHYPSASCRSCEICIELARLTREMARLADKIASYR